MNIANTTLSRGLYNRFLRLDEPGAKLLHPFDARAKFLPWEVESSPIYFNNPYKLNEDLPYDERNNPFDSVATHKRIFRNDKPGETLGIVGKNFAPMTNLRLAETVAAITGDKANCLSAGEANGGESVFFVLPLRETTLPGNDKIKNYLFVSDGKIGNARTVYSIFAYRLVCKNGLMAMVKEAQAQAKHTKNAEMRLKTQFDAIGWGNEMLNAIHDKFSILANLQVSEEQAKDVIAKVFNVYGKKADDVSTRTENMMDEAFTLFHRGEGNHGQTAWHLLNGITEFVDYSRSTRTTDGKDEEIARFDSLVFGSGQTVKAKAFDLCMELAA